MDFAALVRTDTYHVFLTECDSHHHLAVTKQTTAEFIIEAERFGRFTMPTLALPDPVALPKPGAPSRLPAPPRF